MFRVEVKSVFDPNPAVCEGSANDLRKFVPPGWHPILEAFLAEPDATEMRVTSSSLMQTFTFRRTPGAVAEPKEA